MEEKGMLQWTAAWVVRILCLVPCGCALAEITVDANFDEPEWTHATTYNAFLRTEPLALDEPPYATRVHMQATPAGLAVAIECVEPKELRVQGRSQRDAFTMDADPVSVMVDFEGTGKTAYEFTVSLSGSVRDGIVIQQNRFEYDWDGIWYSAVRETDLGWQVEMLLPWSIAPMGVVEDDQRTIGVFIGRELRAQAQRFAYPGIVTQSPSFVADFKKLKIPAYDVSHWGVTPYVSVTRDLLRENTDVRGGADLVWQPNPEQQLAATINPDFGQVESDDLVVNFTAIETFFSDKRPFFTQGQQVFDVRIREEGDRLLHTRRIGAPPDAGPEGSTEILGAAKYFWIDPRWEFGAFTAVEDDTRLAQGRTFGAARMRWKADRWSIGYLGTYVDRPTLNRQAIVHASDFSWSPAPGWGISGQAVTSRPQQASGGTLPDEIGYGVLAKLQYAGTAPITETLVATWYDQKYDTNDMGFMERNNLREVQSETYWYYRREYPAESALSETQWYFNAQLRRNDLNEDLPSSLQVGPYWKYRDGSSLFIYAQPTTSGIDDVSTLGNGSFLLPPQHAARISFRSGPTTKIRYFWYLKVLREGLERYAWEANVNPTWLPTESFKGSLSLSFLNSPDWLIWRPEVQRMTQHSRKLVQASLSAEWFPGTRSEFRMRLQWTGIQAHALQTYDINDTRHLTASDVVASDFSRSEVALQVRFRYQIRPLSDLYIAYSLGGLAQEDEDSAFGQLWRTALQQRTAHQFMVKVSYRL